MTIITRNKISLFAILFPFTHCFSQKESQKEEIIAITVGAGLLSFSGDVNKNSTAGIYSSTRSGFDLSIEKYFSKNISVSMSFLKGEIASSENATDNVRKLNFESPLTQFGLKGTYLLATKNNPSVIPFISSGFSFLLFDPHGDLQDKNGNPYYYWKDGSIRDLPEAGLNYFYAHPVERDYKYETRLTDSAYNYPRNTFAIPLSAGIKLNISPFIDVNLGLAYNFSFSDYLDNVKNAGSDKFLFSFTSITWHFFSSPEKNKKVDSQLFAEMDNTDSDKDGIPDANDLCQGTPKDVKVDSKGCPTDNDGDGVPDYVDKEPQSKAGALVDAQGVELTKAGIKAIINKESKVTAASRKEVLNNNFNQKPSAEFLKEVEEIQRKQQKTQISNKQNSKIPEEFLVADFNKDGFISADEITKTIESFFDGTISLSAAQINKLIDFFFEQ